ncbi:MAG: glycosyltransferase family 9 protein [Ignavibacteria bacterium]|nr:glycosyltransferase family 9 protein [Ignavibacteria bacterium]
MLSKVNLQKIRKVLISRTDNIGDIILTLPLISECKSYFKNVKIVFLTRNVIADLLKGYEDIDDFIFLDEYKSYYELLKKIRLEKFDIVFSAYPRFELALIFFLAKIKYRIGTAYRGYSFLYNVQVREHRKFAEKHEAQYNLNLLNAVTGEESKSLIFKFKITETEKNKLQNKLKEKYGFNPEYKFIIIHPGSRNSAIDLPLNILQEYINVFFRDYKDYKIVITGTKQDEVCVKLLLQHFENELGKKIFNFVSEFNLRELATLIELSSLFISNSTGPIHIAGALGKKIIGFYPNSAPMSPTRWRPLSKYAKILTPVKNPLNMNEITAEQILRCTDELLKM